MVPHLSLTSDALCRGLREGVLRLFSALSLFLLLLLLLLRLLLSSDFLLLFFSRSFTPSGLFEAASFGASCGASGGASSASSASALAYHV